MYIAIVDDDEEFSMLVKKYILRFEKESGEKCTAVFFSNGMDFISDYVPKYDLVLLDIKMPYMDGMTTAEKLREIDSKVALIFITTMSQYAIRGYSVSALDFAVKPIGYADFATKMRKAWKYVKDHGEHSLVVKTPDGMKKINSSKILYVEVMGHSAIFHCKDRDVETRVTLDKIEKDLSLPNFARCNKCYLVNLDYVDAIKNETVVVGKDELVVSQRRRKEFLLKLTDYLGGV